MHLIETVSGLLGVETTATTASLECSRRMITAGGATSPATNGGSTELNRTLFNAGGAEPHRTSPSSTCSRHDPLS